MVGSWGFVRILKWNFIINQQIWKSKTGWSTIQLFPNKIKTAVQCSSQFFGFHFHWLMENFYLKILTKPPLLTKYLSSQLIRRIKSIVDWSSNGKLLISGSTIPLYVSITYEAMEDHLRYIVNRWSWKFKSRTAFLA